jgi:hypothetical protein
MSLELKRGLIQHFSVNASESFDIDRVDNFLTIVGLKERKRLLHFTLLSMKMNFLSMKMNLL